MDTETLVNVENVSRYYDEHCAVADLSFSVKRGEVLGFLGPNGAGKSTTMQIICGVLAASSGSVSIAGRDIINEPLRAREHIGFLPERPPLYPDLKVDEYLLYCARLRGIRKTTLQKAVDNARERCGLKDHGGRLINNLSRGYQQRVGIAQAIIHSPDVVILDEPSSGLDPIQITEIRALLNELGEDHSVILSTHILAEVQSTCNRVLIINRGRLALDENIGHLDKGYKPVVFTIAMRRPPLPEEILALADIEQVDVIDRLRFRITAKDGVNIAEHMVEKAVAGNWGLFELVPDTGSLEQTFLRLTSGEPEQAGPTGDNP